MTELEHQQADGQHEGGAFAAQGERAAERLLRNEMAVEPFTPIPRSVGMALHEAYKYGEHDRLRSYRERETEGVAKDRITVDCFYVDEWALVRVSKAHQIPGVGWETTDTSPRYAIVAQPVLEAARTSLINDGFGLV